MRAGRFWIAAAAAAALIGSAPAAGAAWRKAESENFVIYSRSGETKIREQAALLEDFHQFLRLLSAVTEPPAPNKLHVYLVRGRSELNSVRKLSDQVAGFYAASGSGIAAFADDRDGGWGSMEDEILFHEIAHHFMMQYRPMPYPAWFVEGFAEYVMTARFTPKGIEFGLPSRNRAGWLAARKWLPLERVLFEMPPRYAEESALFYAQSWLLAHYMMRDEVRKKKFIAYLQAAATGTPPRKAFTDQFGPDFRAFEKGLRSYAERGMTYTKITRASAAATPGVKIEQLPASADDLLLLESAMHIGAPEAEQEKLLGRVRSAAARFPGDPYARRVLAEAEVLHGDRNKGDKLLDDLLASSPKDAELLYLKGMRQLLDGREEDEARQARFTQAKTWFARAHKADPNHFPTLARYAESLTIGSGFNSDNTMNILLLAHELAPQVSEIAINAANVLILRGRRKEAANLLLPLASNPHDAGLAAAAARMLERARADEKPVAEGNSKEPAKVREEAAAPSRE